MAPTSRKKPSLTAVNPALMLRAARIRPRPPSRSPKSYLAVCTFAFPASRPFYIIVPQFTMIFSPIFGRSTTPRRIQPSHYPPTMCQSTCLTATNTRRLELEHLPLEQILILCIVRSAKMSVRNGSHFPLTFGACLFKSSVKRPLPLSVMKTQQVSWSQRPSKRMAGLMLPAPVHWTFIRS